MVRTRLNLALAVLLLAGCGNGNGNGNGNQKLPGVKIDPDRVTVSGFSSGAIMAQQVHLAWSRVVDRAGIVSGPPYGCAEGRLDTALARCLVPAGAGPDPVALARVARDRAAQGLIDPLEGLAGDRIWVFRGTNDAIVAEPVVAASATFYEALGGAVVERDFARATAHVFPTVAAGGDCASSASPYIGHCGFDAAGEIFRRVVGGADAPAAQATGTLVRFDQRPFAADGADPSLGDTGFVYVPPQCGAQPCGLHIAFHGCQQSADDVGDAFAMQAGYNAWADAASVVVLYPQATDSLRPLNPKSCWDWWGYTGSEYDTRQGAQLRWLGNVLAALGVKV